MPGEASYHTEKRRFMISVAQHSLLCKLFVRMEFENQLTTVRYFKGILNELFPIFTLSSELY